MRDQLAKVLRLYFSSFRYSVLDVTGWKWGMQSGGISFAPVALLGLLGLYSAARAWRRNLLWLALVATGLAVPLLSVATPRRLLIFDLGWCALAGLGLLRVVDWKPFRSVSPIVPKLLAGALLMGLGLWSFASIALLRGESACRGRWRNRDCAGRSALSSTWHSAAAKSNPMVMYLPGRLLARPVKPRRRAVVVDNRSRERLINATKHVPVDLGPGEGDAKISPPHRRICFGLRPIPARSTSFSGRLQAMASKVSSSSTLKGGRSRCSAT